jgi:hypothetical protein
MFQIVGIALLFGMVFGGYLLSGGHFAVILESLPHEMMTIGGAAVAALLLGNSIGDVKTTPATSLRRSPFPNGRRPSRDLLCLLFFTKTEDEGYDRASPHRETAESRYSNAIRKSQRTTAPTSSATRRA